MTNQEAVYLMASDYAEQAYYELFNTQADHSMESTRLFLDALTHAWMSGYAYLIDNPDLNQFIFEVFGYRCEVL